jgi:hypothetical protein
MDYSLSIFCTITDTVNEVTIPNFLLRLLGVEPIYVQNALETPSLNSFEI